MKLGRKISGGKYHQSRKKKFFERDNQNREAVLGARKVRALRVKGGNIKSTVLRENKVNLTDAKGKTRKADIKNVLETPQNSFFARQNKLLKGAIIETNLGKARITNRPTQEGHINAKLIAPIDANNK